MENMLTIKEVAEKLCVSIDTVRKLVKDGSLKATKVGFQIRIYESGVKEYLDRGFLII